MTTSSRPQRRHLASSPFARPAEVEIVDYQLNDRVSHQTYGLGRVVNKEREAVTVDFGGQKARIVSPFSKLEKL
ncbi:hypothetical protein FB476_0961 [Ornithinimicrobium humiphilum]|uniref:ATP-dependent DNA helicase PcrA n=1 Tax=Ornithinimicrobium humiphilum TaxID=125288 RepID=A0A543KM09_9MICO|nr:hypothetical protein [Ornithinimicrobium humiphilum]TQM96101.1 hypothetical protein FB476_0961 [Ornithinimicrobium humiphilum]